MDPVYHNIPILNANNKLDATHGQIVSIHYFNNLLLLFNMKLNL